MKCLSIILSLSLPALALAIARPAIERDLASKLKILAGRELPSKARVHVERLYFRDKPPQNASLTLLSPHPPLGEVHVQATWLQGGRMRRTFGGAVVRGLLPVAVAKAPIRRGEAFTPSNVAFEERELGAFAATGFYSDWSQLSPLRARAPLAPGTVLGTASAEQPFAVSQGQMVELVSRHGALRLSARVRALQNGRVAGWIRVQNPATQKVIQARVTAPGEVAIR